MYWEQGWSNAPELVKQCRKSWERHNPDYDIRCLDKDSVLEYFDIEKYMPGEALKPKWLAPLKKWLHKSLHSTELIKTKKIKIQHRSDIIRFNLLKQYGGVWADATLFCRKPLNQWIKAHTKQDFFAFSNPGPRLPLKDGSLPIFTSYFLIASKNNFMIRDICSRIYKHCQENQHLSRYYLFVFDIFNQCYHNNKEFSATWDKVVKIDAPIPNAHEFDKSGGVEFFAWQTPEQLNNLSGEYKKMLQSSQAPVFKLSNKEIYSPKNSSCICYLMDDST